MNFSDPSGDDGIHPVSPLILPDINPPPSRSVVVHRSRYSVVPYKKHTKPHNTQHGMIPHLNIDHLYYKVKDMLDDGTASSVEKFESITESRLESKKFQLNKRRSSYNKPSKYLDDGSSCLKKEIVFSEERVRSIKAGKALHYIFPEPSKKFIEPNKNFYNRQRLGTPLVDINSKELQFYNRKRQISLMNSSPHKPLIMLPSLKDILLSNEQNKEGIFQTGSTLTQKFEKMDKTFTKKFRKDSNQNEEVTEKRLVSIVKNQLKSENISDMLKEDPVGHVLERFQEFEDGKEKLKIALKELLATQKYDRPESIWLKYKHFKTSEKASVYQGRMLDI